jgi:hypothetical protein
MRSLYDKAWHQLRSDRSRFKDDIDQEATPILVFGQFNRAKIVTVGMNPSEREFRNQPKTGAIHGPPLSHGEQRFLHWPQDGKLTADLRELAFQRMGSYFTLGRSYKRWFDRYAPLLRGLSADYESGAACHTDVVSPFATARGIGNCKPETIESLKKFGGKLWVRTIEKIPRAELIFGCGSVRCSIQRLGIIQTWQEHETPFDKKGGKTKIPRPFLISAQAKLPVSGRPVIVFCWKPNMDGAPLCWLNEVESETLGNIVGKIARSKGFLN